MEINIIFGILIFILSIFQSIFGIGLLALGTPILLIIGFSFIESLFLLLPCSITVSLITFLSLDKKSLEVNIIKDFVFFSIPGILIGLVIIFFYELSINFKILIGFTIIASLFLKKFIKKGISYNRTVKKIISLFVGFIHGISNMGGSFLSIYLMTLYSKKIKIRYHLTFAYIFFATTQLIFLSMAYIELLNFISMMNYILVSITGTILGNISEKYLGNSVFIKILNTCIFITAIVLITDSFDILL